MSQRLCGVGQGRASGTKKRLRFTYNDDLPLLREFVGQNPLVNPEGWELLQQNLHISTGKAFTIRTIKQHLILIIEIWIKKDEVDKVRSGIEDAYSERDMLLQEASVLCKEFNFLDEEKKKKKSCRDVQALQLGKKVRNGYLGHISTVNKDMKEIDGNASSEWQQDSDTSACDQENDHFIIFNDHDYGNCVDIELEPSSDKTNNNKTLVLELESSNNRATNKRTLEVVSPKNSQGWLASSSESVTSPLPRRPADQNSGVPVPARKRSKREPLRKNALSYLSQKSEKEFAIRTKELELEERKIAIEERRVCLEEDRLRGEKHKLELECDERKQRIQAETKEKEITYTMLHKMMDILVEKCNKA